MDKIPDLVLDNPGLPPSLSFFFFPPAPTPKSQTFQNFKFSSPAPVTTVSPAGPIALNSTLISCASLISATFSIDGYACTIRALVGYPWVVRSSLRWGHHWMEVIWAGVCRVCSRAPVLVFQMLIVASCVPPPEARREGCQGHHAIACVGWGVVSGRKVGDSRWH